MVLAEISLSTELGKEKLLAQVRSWVERWVEKRFPQDHLNRKLEIDYRRRAEFWATQIEPGVSLAVRIAALTHDVARLLYPEHEKDQKNYSARIVGRSLGGLRLPKGFVKSTTLLVRDYETGDNSRSTFVRHAVDIAFLEVKAPHLISEIPKRRSWQETRDEIDSIYDRIYIPKARREAEKFYNEAMIQLEEKGLGKKRLEEKRQQARAEFWKLVEESKLRSLSEEEISALKKACGEILSFGQ